MSFLPIFIGAHEKADKCAVIAADKKYGGYSLIVCKLKKEADIWDKPKKEELGRVLCHLHFCKLESAKVFQTAINEIVEKWEAENENL